MTMMAMGDIDDNDGAMTTMTTTGRGVTAPREGEGIASRMGGGGGSQKNNERQYKDDEGGGIRGT